jgi:hypothetical protein
MYALVTALVFAIVAMLHVVRLLKRWPVHIGSYSVPMSLSLVGLAASGGLAVWGFMHWAG